MRVFVIDDNQLHLKMCKILLNNLGHDVTTVASLNELQKVAEQIEVPDIALIDYRLSPGETGIDVLNFLRETAVWPGCRKVALTADIGERATLESAGFDKVVFKPVTEALLKEIVR